MTSGFLRSNPPLLYTASGAISGDDDKNGELKFRPVTSHCTTMCLYFRIRCSFEYKKPKDWGSKQSAYNGADPDPKDPYT